MDGRSCIIAHGDFTTDDSFHPIGCRGIMAKDSYFTCVKIDTDNELKVLCTLNTEHGNLGPVASIGNGYFGIGRQIFKFGIEKAVCTLPKDCDNSSIKSGTSDITVTRVISCNEDGTLTVMHATANCPAYMHVVADSEEPSANVTMHIFNVTADSQCIPVGKHKYCLEVDSFWCRVTFWKNHLIISSAGQEWPVVDCMTCVVVDKYHPPEDDVDQIPSFNLKTINHGTQLAVYYGNSHEYYDESSECDDTESEPVVRLLVTLDIVDGKLVEMDYFIIQRDDRDDIISRAFGKRTMTNYLYRDFICMPDILHLNRTMRSMMKHVNASVPGHKPTVNDEVLVYIPTATILPIRGSDVHKDITIIDSLVSTCGTYMVMIVTARDSHDTRLQICALNVQTGQADCATVALFYHYEHQVSARLQGFVSGNKAVLYSRTNADGIETVVKQPIFNGVLDCKAEELFNKLNGTLPLEVTRHIVDFM